MFVCSEQKVESKHVIFTLFSYSQNFFVILFKLSTYSLGEDSLCHCWPLWALALKQLGKQ